MTLSDLCKGLYPACHKIKSQYDFIDALFMAGGNPAYMSVSYKKQIFSNPEKLTVETVRGFSEKDNLGSLSSFFEKNITASEIASRFGLPISGTIDIKGLSYALAMQFRAIVANGISGADDIIMMEYQHYLSIPQEAHVSAQSVSVLYPGDNVYSRSQYRPTYEVDIYKKFQHTWDFENAGCQTWTGRKLFFANHNEVRVRAEQNYIDLPDLPPHKGIKITASMDVRGFNGRTECKWIMVDKDENNCFPNSSTFDFVVIVKYAFHE